MNDAHLSYYYYNNKEKDRKGLKAYGHNIIMDGQTKNKKLENLSLKVKFINGHDGKEIVQTVYSAKQLFKLLKTFLNENFLKEWHYRIYVNNNDIVVKYYKNGVKDYYKPAQTV